MSWGHQAGNEEPCSLLLALPLTCCVANRFLFRWLSFSCRPMQIMIHPYRSPSRMKMENVIEEWSRNSIPVLSTAHPWSSSCWIFFRIMSLLLWMVFVRDNKAANYTAKACEWIKCWMISIIYYKQTEDVLKYNCVAKSVTQKMKYQFATHMWLCNLKSCHNISRNKVGIYC